MIYLVRHGETAYNRDGVGLGRSDISLTELGEAQAAAVASKLGSVAPVVRVLSSPLTRAFTVATLVAARHSLEVESHESLTELDVGETEGLGFPEMRERFPEFLREWGGEEGWQAKMPGGESIEDLASRLAHLAAELRASESGNIVVVSHNFTLRVLLCQLLGLELRRFRSFELGLASITTLWVRGGRVGVRSLNDTCHLANLSLA